MLSGAVALLGIATALLWMAGETHRSSCVREGKVGCSMLPWVAGKVPPPRRLTAFECGLIPHRIGVHRPPECK